MIPLIVDFARDPAHDTAALGASLKALLGEGHEPLGALQQLGKRYRLFIVCRGLGEFATYLQRDTFRTILHLSDTTILIVTDHSPGNSQLEDVRSGHKDFINLRLRPLSMEDQIRYVRAAQACRAVTEDHGSELIEFVRERPSFLDRLLLLEIVLLTGVRVDSDWANVGELFAALVDATLQRRYETDLRIARMEAVMAEVAFILFREGRESLELGELLDHQDVLSRYSSDDISDAVTGNPLMRADERGLRFGHPSIADYFVARKLLADLRSERTGAWNSSNIGEAVLHILGGLVARSGDRRALEETLERWIQPGMAPAQRSRAGSLQSNSTSVLVHLDRRLKGIKLWGVNLSGANLTGADLRQSLFIRVRFSGANLDRARLQGSKFIGCDFSNAFVSNTDWRGAVTAGCNLFNWRWTQEPTSVWAMTVLPEVEGTLVVGLSSGVLALFNRATGESQYQTFVDGSGILDVAARPGSKEVFVSDRAGRLHIVVLERRSSGWSSERNSSTKGPHFANIRRVRFSPDGADMATACRDGSVRIFPCGETYPSDVHTSHRSPVMDLAWSPSCQQVASVGYDGCLQLYDRVAARVRAIPSGLRVGHRGVPVLRAVAFRPDGERIIVGDEEGRVVELDVSTGDQASHTQLSSPVFSTAYFGDSILAGCWDGSIWQIHGSLAQPIARCSEVVRVLHTSNDAWIACSWAGEVVDGDSVVRLASCPGGERGASTEFVGSRWMLNRGLPRRHLDHIRSLGGDVRF